RALSVVGPREEPAARLDLPSGELYVLADEQHLTRLFANLLENALDHTPHDGSVTVRARRANEVVLVTVCDTGEGSPPEHLPHLCERSYRVDRARSRAHGGTGLGLAICKSIVEAHGGRLAIESAVGVGTTVRVTLPVAGEEDATLLAGGETAAGCDAAGAEKAGHYPAV